ncbi:hypothetical protein B0A48_18764 [Cryoendolithus antarcticus]|uniref:Uncharacterized protein n=1 Tax=Cryoendolithus antarcticus TaxID=1507870 RepID=A0A1V8S7M3_9PEZI|nr:hypothetical protein B0A48_18764 [Cryoendolithus antarcticus]
MRREMGLWKINRAEKFKLTANMERLLKFELGQGQSKTLAMRGSHIIHNYKDRLYNVEHVVNAEDVERLDNGAYRPDQLAHKLAFVAIHVPIIQQEAIDFVHNWNNPRIRKQSNRGPDHITCISSVLYHYPEKTGGVHCGTAPDPKHLQPMQEELKGSEMNAILPEETVAWIKVKLGALGYREIIDGRKSVVN